MMIYIALHPFVLAPIKVTASANERVLPSQAHRVMPMPLLRDVCTAASTPAVRASDSFPLTPGPKGPISLQDFENLDTGEDAEFVHGDLLVLWSPLAHNRSLCCSDLPSGQVAPSKSAVTEIATVPVSSIASVARASWIDRYFEGQTLAHCGMHALNNLVAGPQFTPPDMAFAWSRLRSCCCRNR